MFFLAAATALAGLLTLSPRSLTAPLPDQVELAELTWVEVRTMVEHGYTTAIVPSGGIEQNGPHLVLGKHDRIVAYTAKRIAAALGRTLVTPVVSFVPQGAYNPPAGHLRFPGTLGVPEEVFAGTLEGIARSLKAAGFRTICFIADHGGSLPAQNAVAERLGREWAREGVRVVSVQGYAADEAQLAWLRSQGETPASIGRHGGIQDTAELLAAYPAGVKLERRGGRSAWSEPTGADGDPARASPERGRKLLEMKIEAAVAAIRAARGDLALRGSASD
ncbi:creatininase family protein [Enterovirga aerilata]|uniref:Creatininase family protein n=1 Tax=Enterovirga aerilata TaxID=2730920 RepID=A0A849I8E7_9HYPH|nr:creatininase family protein [Enterovirga sp. DB1703]NNM73668.1 creatininase family protein [Enterovirga sp. DB1703]